MDQSYLLCLVIITNVWFSSTVFYLFSYIYLIKTNKIKELYTHPITYE